MGCSAQRGRLRRFLIRTTLAGLATALVVRPLEGQLTPDNFRVRQVVDKGIQFLREQSDGRVGAKALMGLTFAKYGAPADDPKIQEAISAIQAQVKNGPEGVKADIYSTGIAIMCLVALDPSKYRYEIETLVASLHARQKKHGAWGYPPTHPTHGETCDTSMTQYAVLGLWEAEDQAGVETPPEIWDQVAQWLILTQDPEGGFGYQGTPANRLGRTVKQAGVRHSMTAAAMASLLIVKDRVGVRKLKKTSDDETPAAFEPFETELELQARIKTAVDLRDFARAMAAGNRWIEDKYDVDNLKSWVYYSLYALERWESLREAELAGSVEPLPKSEKSKWYNRGARYLLRNQAENGSWESDGGPVPDTCFAILFLLGSTRKTLASSSVATYSSGRLIGGRGLPATDQVRVRDGRVVVLPLQAPAEQILAILADPSHAQHAAAVESLADWARTGKSDQLRLIASRLARLALEGQGEVRLLAIAAVAQSRDLDQVPLLIHLLEAGDPAAAAAASDGLGTLSRKFDAIRLGREAGDAERRLAAEAWKAWYRSVRPEADVNVFDVFRD